MDALQCAKEKGFTEIASFLSSPCSPCIKEADEDEEEGDAGAETEA
jgi:hypothetical protein